MGIKSKKFDQQYSETELDSKSELNSNSETEIDFKSEVETKSESKHFYKKMFEADERQQKYLYSKFFRVILVVIIFISSITFFYGKAFLSENHKTYTTYNYDSLIAKLTSNLIEAKIEMKSEENIERILEEEYKQNLIQEQIGNLSQKQIENLSQKQIENLKEEEIHNLENQKIEKKKKLRLLNESLANTPNFLYVIRYNETGEVVTNTDIKLENFKKRDNCISYEIKLDDYGNRTISTNWKNDIGSGLDRYYNNIPMHLLSEYDCNVYVSTQNPLIRGDELYDLYNKHINMWSEYISIRALVILSSIVFIIFFILLMIVVGRDKCKGAVTLWKIDKIYIEYLTIGTFGIIILSFILVAGFFDSFGRIVLIISEFIFFSISILILLAYICSMVRQYKYFGFKFIKNTFLYKVKTKMPLKHFEFKFTKSNIYLGKIKNAIDEIADGNTFYEIDTKKMPQRFKIIFESIKNMQKGFNTVIDKAIKGERMKTELITNVSHDLKTPLTSIINYVDLLKKENLQNQKAVSYLNILEEKSERLKQLIDDLMEASKASSGNISVMLEKLDLNQLIMQSYGEYEAKLSKKELKIKIDLADNQIFISADGKHMWRILSNLLSNIAKYAMTNSRVYITVSDNSNYGILTIKNISAEQLNISAEQLTERFIRGDSSRATEGSGLGLSIAQSLTQLQNGIFEIEVDGDLFKVTVKMPLLK